MNALGRARLAVAASLLPMVASSLGCTGEVGPLGASGSSTGNGPGQTGQAGAPGSTGPEPVARLEKLTASQFANSVHDLLGKDAPLGPVEPDNVVDGFA